MYKYETLITCENNEHQEIVTLLEIVFLKGCKYTMRNCPNKIARFDSTLS